MEISMTADDIEERLHDLVDEGATCELHLALLTVAARLLAREFIKLDTPSATVEAVVYNSALVFCATVDALREKSVIAAILLGFLAPGYTATPAPTPQPDRPKFAVQARIELAQRKKNAMPDMFVPGKNQLASWEGEV